MKNIIFSLIILFSITISAQRPGNGRPQKGGGPNSETINIKGKVIDAQSKQSLEYATIILKHKRSKKIMGGITDENGIFNIEVRGGFYEISVEYISFITKKLEARPLKEDTDFGTIELKEYSNNLDEIVVISEKSTVEIRLDKKIYNVGKDMTVKGGSASDVLDNVPSVNVDVEGAVSLRGNENVRILIDGKPSALVGLSGTDALKNLPADAIEKVEVITSPSARYDAEGTAGILNIILRKGKITGFNGSLNFTAGNPDSFRFAPNLNYRTKKINLFSSIGYSYRRSPGNSQSYFTNFKNGAISDYRDEERIFDRKSNGINASLGLEYYINKNSSIIGAFFYRDSKDDDVATNVTSLFDANRTLTSTQNRIENEQENGTNKQYSINYTNNFDKKGERLSIDLQYGDSQESEPSTVLVDNSLTEINSQVTASKNKLLQIDYVLPIGENSQFEIGQKSTLENLNSDFRVRDKDGKALVNDPSNAIIFDQNVYAFYTQFGTKYDKFSYLLGLRVEITDIELNLLTTNTITEKNYTQFFPTVNLGYEIEEGQSLTLGYSKRLRRPRHRYLSPFESRSSATNIFKGNPDLNPTFTNSFDLGYNTKIKKFNLGASLYYQYSTDIFQIISTIEERVISNVDTDVSVRFPTNQNDEKRIGFEFTSNYNPSKKVRLSASFNYFKFNTEAFTYNYTTISGVEKATFLKEIDNSSWFSRFNARITLPGKIQWQTRAMYSGPRSSAQDDRIGIFSASLSFSKDLFKDNGTLVLNINDLLNSRKREGITYFGGRDNPNTISDNAYQRRERQISLSFTYLFNQKKKKERQKRGSFDEGDGGEEF